MFQGWGISILRTSNKIWNGSQIAVDAQATVCPTTSACRTCICISMLRISTRISNGSQIAVSAQATVFATTSARGTWIWDLETWDFIILKGCSLNAWGVSALASRILVRVSLPSLTNLFLVFLLHRAHVPGVRLNSILTGQMLWYCSLTLTFSGNCMEWCMSALAEKRRCGCMLHSISRANQRSTHKKTSLLPPAALRVFLLNSF